MQIHEVFRRQPVKEGVLGGIATYAQSAMANKLQQAVPGVTGLGAAFAPGGDKVSTGQAQGMATKLTADLVPKMAKAAQDNWTSGILNLFRAKGVDNVAAVQQDANDLILKIVNNNLLDGQDYKQMVSSIDPAAAQGEAKTMAKVATDNIDKAIKIIASDANNQQKTAAFQQLAQGAAQLKSMVQFHGKGAGAGRTGGGAQTTAITKMAQTAAAGKLTAKQLQIPSNVLSNIQTKIPPGTDPKIDMLFTALGIYQPKGAMTE